MAKICHVRCRLEKSGIKPTEAELAEAGLAIANLDAKGKRSKENSLGHFLKSNPDAVCQLGMKQQKEKFLELYHVHQTRTRNADKENTTIHVEATKRELISTLNWAAEEELLSKRVRIVGKGWIDSGILPTRPCFVTKRTDRYYRQFGYPEGIEKFTESQLREWRQHLDKELEGEEAEWLTKNCGKLNVSGAATAGSINDPVIVVEESPEKKATRELAERIETVEATARNVSLEVSRDDNIDENHSD